MAIQIGLIGAGRMGNVHASILAHHLADAQLVAIADVDAERARSVAQRLGVPRHYSDYRELLASDIDACVIATPSHTHEELVHAALLARLPVFCEKPLTLTPATSAALSALAADTGVPLQVGFNYRYHPAYKAARTALLAGEIGKPLLFKALQRDELMPSPAFCRPESSGGILVDMGIHEFDLMRWFFEDEVREVYALAPPVSDERIRAAGDLDRALISLRLRSGAVGSVELARNVYYSDESRHDLLGSAGTMIVGQPPQTNLLIANPERLRGEGHRESVGSMNESYRAEMAAFLHTVATGDTPEADGAASLAALNIALAAYKSLQEGIPIQL